MKKIDLWMKVLGTLLLLGFASGVWASTPSNVSLVPISPTTDLVNGDTVTFDVFIDFAPEQNGTLGGGFDVVFDPIALGFVSLVSAGLGDPAFGRDPDILPGLLQSWAVGDFNGGLGASGPERVGSVTFQVLSTMGAITTIEVTPTTGIGGPWISGSDFVTILNPVYNQVNLYRLLPDAMFSDGFESPPVD